jgi:hypothetical protein
VPRYRDDLGPLYTISDEELTRPALRREDRDVLVLRIEIDAQRREVARLTTLLAGREPLLRVTAGGDRIATAELDSDKILFSARVSFQQEGTPGFLNHGTVTCVPSSDRG